MGDQEDAASMSSQTITVEAVKRFIDSKTRNYEIPANSGNAMITALNKVFSVEAEPDQVDLTSIDLDDVFSRFRLKSVELNDASFNTYKSRVRRAIAMYTNWVNGEPWKDTVAPRRTNVSRKARMASSRQDKAADVHPAVAVHQLDFVRPAGDDTPDGLFDYPVRLVDAGVTAVLRLPPTYTVADAERMAALIRALAVAGSASSGEE